ncbi:MAG: hypothetical protein KF715_07840 [Candidatus Didemnitutus sp.]|nr:hypothetical protein [Candidatus Didemnitutus sp.]
MNYENTFIAVAADTKATAGTPPKKREGKPTIAEMEYEMIAAAPYAHTQEDVQFAVHVKKCGFTPAELKARRAALWREFFAQPMACMRTSPLAKTYGWGLHFNPAGKVALVGVESAEYRRLAKDRTIAQTRAMRSAR